MQFIFVFLLVAFSATNLYSATVQFESTPLGTVNGQSLFRNSYVALDFSLQLNQALEIEFDQAQYGTLSNAQGPANFNLLLLQPNNPPGVAGLFSALALNIAQPPMSFGVNYIFLGTGQPSTQRFFINQFDAAGSLVSTITSGVTTPPSSVIPEPSGLALGGLGVLGISAWRAMQRRRRKLSPVENH